MRTRGLGFIGTCVSPLLIVMTVCRGGMDAKRVVLPLPPIPSPERGQTRASHQIDGLDAHDGKIVQSGSTYYLYGTRYGVGSSPACANRPFAWSEIGTPFCGFAVWSSTDKATWKFERLLFDPLSVNSTLGNLNLTWQHTCSTNTNVPLLSGCFNPRMLRRHDGHWMIWFNAPADTRENAYYTMECSGPAGPCGPTATKPKLTRCRAQGDFDIADTADGVFLVCTKDDQTIATEQLDDWWRDAIPGTGIDQLGGLTNVEAPSLFGEGQNLYVTFSQPNCGYCNTNGTGWARSTHGMAGPWMPGPSLSSNSCGGQPRTIAWIDNKPWQWIDLWSPNEDHTQDKANIRLEPIQRDQIGNIRPFLCAN